MWQGGGGRTGRTRRRQTGGGSAGRSVPSTRRKWNWDGDSENAGCRTRGASLATPSPTPGWVGLWGRRAAHRTSQAPGCAQEAAARAVPELQSGGREGTARTCIVQARLPAESLRTLGAEILACAARAGPSAFGQVVTGQRRLSALWPICFYIHSFMHPSVIQLRQELVSKTVGDSRAPHSSRLWSDGRAGILAV